MTHPLFLLWRRHNALSKEEAVVIVELQVLGGVLASLFLEELDESVGQYPADLPANTQHR